jgi:Ca2+:H+ antiporter
VITLATLTLVVPTFTTSARGPVFAPAQLVFAATASLVVYGLFVATQTVRHREYFLPVDPDGQPLPDTAHARPNRRTATISMALLGLALVAIVGDAKLISPALERGVSRAGLPHGVVGVVIALLVLMPEALAAVAVARRGRLQIAINLALGSAIASIGLTVPAIAFAKIWLDGPLLLGLGPTQIVELALTALVCALTIVPGRATLLQAGLHLSLMAAFLVLAVAP